MLLVLGLLGAFHYITQSPQWWRYSPTEQITKQPLFHGNLLVLATNYGNISALNKKTGAVSWSFERGQEITAGPKLHYGKLYIAYRDGYVHSLDAKTGKEEWSYQIPDNNILQTDLVLHKTKVMFGDANGTIYALTTSNGKIAWKVHTPTPASIDQLLTKNGFLWFGELILDRDTLYAVRTHGYVVAIATKSGRELWHTNVDSTVLVNPFITRKSLIISTTNQTIVALHKKTGKLLYSEQNQDSSDTTFCQNWYYPESLVSEIVQTILARLPLPNKPKLNQEVVQLTKIGVVRGFNHRSFQQEWELQLPFAPKNCFFYQDQSLYVSSDQGELLKVDLKKQSIVWQKKFPNQLFYINSIRTRNDDRRTNLLTEYLITSDALGSVYRLEPSTGEMLWTVPTNGEMYVPPTFFENILYIISTNGGLYRLDPKTGQPARSQFFPPAVSWKENTKTVNPGEIYELTFQVSDNDITNPHEEVELSAQFVNSEGKSISIDGFYYDKNVWKLRFNPPTVGDWSWKVTWKDSYQTKSFEGTFTSTRSFTHLYVDPTHPLWLTRDGKTIAAFVGINDCLSDWNKNGYPLDDFFLPGDSLKVATIAGTVPQTLRFNSTVVRFPNFIKNYKSGFNLFRQNVSNCSPSLFDPEKFSYSKYLTQEGKLHDEVSQSLYKENYTVWFTLFGFSLPFGDELNYQDQKVAVENYIKYVVARYGAYVDIWEISNEAVASEKYITFIAELLKKYDPYDRIISVSWEKPHLSEITLTAPHWYATEKDSESDLATIAQIEKFKEYQKPIIFGEQGNKEKNWDDTSARRMRVRIWTAFFHNAFLSFWNQVPETFIVQPFKIVICTLVMKK